MKEEEVVTHVGSSSQVFRDRLNGGDMGKKCGDMAWPCDLALYALRTDVLVVLLDTGSWQVCRGEGVRGVTVRSFGRGGEEASDLHSYGQ